MPNHIFNRIRLVTDEERRDAIIREVMSLEDGPGTIDFNRIIPMPESLDITDGTMTDRGEELYEEYLARSAARGVPEGEPDAELIGEITGGDPDRMAQFELGRQAYTNREQYGFRSWYGWCIANWGTKWNAYSLGEDPADDGTIAFYTAWNCPEPVVAELSRKYPDVRVVLEWADEDIGSNLGVETFLAGELIDADIPQSQSRRAYEMFESITGEDLEDIGFYFDREEGTYVYRERGRDTQRDIGDREM